MLGVECSMFGCYESSLAILQSRRLIFCYEALLDDIFRNRGGQPRYQWRHNSWRIRIQL